MINEKFCIRLVDKHNDFELKEAAKVINQAFLKQVVARTDRPTITAQEIKELLCSNSKEAFILSNFSNEIIGTAFITLECSYVYIWCVSIAPAYQGLNLGLKLMKHIENRAVAIYKKELAVLSVVYHPKETQEQLVLWYKRQGYQYSHDQKPSSIAEIWKLEFHKELTLKVFQKYLTLH